ncbi:M16 family metallopeptidase [Neisseria sp.]|uniref:M16 family metallopeptidase n=1 Tax=Neisseria sp. TaxID=192066 RepID=UPI00359FC7DB
MSAKTLFPLMLALPLAAQAAVNIQRWNTPEGTKILLVERHENPIVDMEISFKGAGSVSNPPGKSEVAEFTASLLTDGTKRLDEEAFNAAANDIAANIASESGQESASVSMRSLSKPATLNAAVKLVNESLTQPRFDPAVFARRQKQSITALQQQQTNPGYIANRTLTRLNYPQHPYGSGAWVSEERIRKVTLADIRSFHKSRYGKSNAVVAIVGAVSRKQAERLAAAALKNLPVKAPAGTVAPVPANQPRRENVAFAGEQAQIMLGMPLFKRKDPDYFALFTGNYILGGGGFDSRLMKVLRDKHGYTYGAGSSLSPMSEAGPFTIGFATQKANSQAALAAAEAVVKDFIANGPTEEELKQAKANITGGFPLRFDTNAKLLGYLSTIGVHNLPDNWLETYPKAVNALTAADIKNAWQRRVKAENLNVVVVGAQ